LTLDRPFVKIFFIKALSNVEPNHNPDSGLSTNVERKYGPFSGVPNITEPKNGN